MSDEKPIVKPNQRAMKLVLDLWARRLQRLCDEQAQYALAGYEPKPLNVIAPTQADAAHVASVLEQACAEAYDAGVSAAWSVAEHYTAYGVLPQRSKERKIADAITNGIRELKSDRRAVATE